MKNCNNKDLEEALQMDRIRLTKIWLLWTKNDVNKFNKQLNLLPTTFGLQSHWPPRPEHIPESEPVGSHSHSKLRFSNIAATGQI